MKPICAMLAVAGLIQTADATDLLSVYREAQLQDPVFAGATAAHQAAMEKLPQGRSLLLPTLGLSASTAFNRNNTQFRTPSPFLVGGQKNYNTNGYTLTLSQPIFRWQNFAAYDEAKLQVAEAEAQFAAARQDLILRVAQAYFAALLAEDNLELARAQKAAISEALAQAKRNFEVGTATITDTNEAQARFDLIQAQEIAAQSDLEVKRRALETLTGKYERDLAHPGEIGLKAPEPLDVEKWVQSAMEGNLQVVGAEVGEKIAEREIDRNRAGHYPSLDLVASYGKNSATGNPLFGPGTDTTASAVGLQLNLPLYQGGLVSSKVRETIANRDKSRQDLENARRTASLSTREAYLGVTNGMAQVKALEQALVSSQSSLDSTKLGLEVGVRTNVDLLNAQQQLYSAKRDLFQARYNYLISGLRLKAATGSLADLDLQAVNRALH